MYILRWFFCLLLCMAPALAPGLRAEPVRVTVRPFAELAFYPYYEVSAEVHAPRYTSISSRMEAKVETPQAAVGDQVQAGQVLARLDCRIPKARAAASKARVAAVQARLERTRLSIKRLQSLNRQAHASKDELDDQRALALELQATQRAEQAEGQALDAQVQDCNITAPFTGMIVEKSISPGQLASPGETLYTLLDPDALEVTAGIHERRTAGFFSASEYIFTAVGGEPTQLKLKASPLWVDPEQRTRPVYLEATGGQPLIAGRSGSLRWKLDDPHLPGRLLVRYEEGYGVYLAADGEARFMPVAAAQEGRAFVLRLMPQALVVTEGAHGLHDGQRLTVHSAP